MKCTTDESDGPLHQVTVNIDKEALRSFVASRPFQNCKELDFAECIESIYLFISRRFLSFHLRISSKLASEMWQRQWQRQWQRARVDVLLLASTGGVARAVARVPF